MSTKLQRFIELWTHPDYPPNPVSCEQLREVESRLGQLLPKSYVDAVAVHSLPSATGALLDAIVQEKADVPDVNGFFSPTEISEVSIAWRPMGLPDQFVAFADDCQGNLFCFELHRGNTERLIDAAVWHFDHERGTSEALYLSFESWLQAYCAFTKPQV